MNHDRIKSNWPRNVELATLNCRPWHAESLSPFDGDSDDDGIGLLAAAVDSANLWAAHSYDFNIEGKDFHEMA